MPADTAAPRPTKTTHVDETSETLKRTSDSLNQVAGEAMACCSDTLAAAVESGTESSRLMADIAKSYLDACGSAVAMTMEIMRESVTCRTPADLVALQQKGFQALNSSIGASLKLYTDGFTAYSKAFEPLVAKAANAPERLFRAIAD